MKPLSGESPTGFWRYNGTPISEADQKYYESRGVKFLPHPNGDLMPDGIRLKPKKNRSDSKYDLIAAGRNSRGRNKEPIVTEAILDQQFEIWQNEYDTLEAVDGKKPDFTEWAHEKYVKPMIYKALLRNALCSERIQQSAKSVSTYFEFYKPRPKSQVEVSMPDQPVQNMTARDVLALALELNGLDPSNAVKLLGGVHKQIQ